MSHFPGTLQPPESVFRARAERKRQMVQSVGWGVIIRLIIILCEFVGVVLFGSSALFMDALSSLIDVVCSLFLLLFIKLAERPPDENHPFGHGRYEPLAGLQLGILLVVVGLGMLVQQGMQLTVLPAGELDRRAWIIPLCAVVLLEICYFIVMRTAKRQHSPALAADAVHYRIDSLTSLFAAVALILAAYFPSVSLAIDHVGAIAISFLMVVIGAFAVRNNLNQLLDHVPEPHFFTSVRKAAKSVSGVLDTEKIRIQLYGPDAHVDIEVEVEPQLSVEEAHKISQEVRVEIQKEWPAVRDVTVHIEPYYPNDH
jgi:cation diffusion facilitator family transporter